MTYLIGAGIGFAFFLLGEFAYLYGLKKGRAEQLKAVVEAMEDRRRMDDEETPIHLSNESFKCHDKSHAHTDKELDNFLATHECENHQPIKEASQRKRVAEALKAHMRNRKSDGRFAKGSKPKKK